MEMQKAATAANSMRVDPAESTAWVVIVYRRDADGRLVTEVMETRDEITAERYFDKLSGGPDHVRMLQARVTRTLGSVGTQG
jgi:hypothetical protein